MATKKVDQKPKLPESQPKNSLTIEDHINIVNAYYAEMEDKKLLSCKDAKSRQDYENLFKEAQKSKGALAVWHLYICS